MNTEIAQENELFRKILEARDRWLKGILSRGVIDARTLKDPEQELERKLDTTEQLEDNFYMQGESDRSQKKVLYLVLPKIWNEIARDELDSLKAELDKAKTSGIKISRKLWLPTVIENAEKILAKAYEAKSVKRVSLKTARKFALKAGLDKKTIEKYLSNEDDERWTSTVTGKKYKLVVTNLYGNTIYPFTDWAVCLCSKKTIPELKKRTKIQTKSTEDHSKIILCSQGNVTLFMKN